jgi:hypothetical protein
MTDRQLDAFTKLVQACLRPHGRSRLVLDGFLWNLIFEGFFNLCRANLSLIKIWKITGTLNEDVCTFITTRWSIPRMRYVSDKNCRESQNTHFIFNNFYPKFAPFMRKCGKISWSQRGRKWQYNTAHSPCMLDNEGYTHTHTHTLSLSLRIYNTY